MFKKLLKITLALFFVSPALLLGVESSRSSPDIVAYTQFREGGTTVMFRIDYDGNILPGNELFSDIGESSHPYKTVYAGSLNVSNGILIVEDTWETPVASDTDSFRVGGFNPSTGTMVNGTTSFVTIDFSSQPDYARNVTIFSTCPCFHATSTTPFSGSATFYGLNTLGTTTQELVRFSSSTNFGVGNVAWLLISSITVEITSTAINSSYPSSGVTLFIGTTNQFGLTNRLNAPNNVVKVLEGKLNNPVGDVSLNTTYHTIRFETVPNGATNYRVRYKAKLSPE